MTRTERMQPVKRVLGETEKDKARVLGEAQQRLRESEQRLQELRNYAGEYQLAFRQRAESGTNIRKLRDFQAFLARLDEALRQQEQIVANCREQAAGSRAEWQGAARQVKAVDKVMHRWQAAETTAGAKRDQKDTDERAQRSVSRGASEG